MGGAGAAPTPGPAAAAAPSSATGSKPVLPPDVAERFLRPRNVAQGASVSYRPAALGVAKLHFVDAKSGIDAWQTASFLAPVSDDGREALWSEASRHGDLKGDLDAQPLAGAAFGALPSAATNAKTMAAWQKSLEAFIYETVTTDIAQCPALKMSSQAGESEGDFRARLDVAVRERRDAEVEKLRKKYAPRVASLQEQLRKAGERVEREKAQLGQQKMSTAITVGATLLGALFGGGRGMSRSITGAASSMKSASRIGREAGDVNRASDSVEAVQQRLAAIEQEMEQEVARLQGELDASQIEVTRAAIRPRKSDISVAAPAIVWMPWVKGADGMEQPAWG
jgi:hypothetical protein